MTLLPASRLQPDALLELFNDSYSDYVIPLRLRAEDLSEHLSINAIDLGLSRFVHADVDGPAAFALIARRGNAGWVGGMGVRPAARRRGLGERALRAAIAAAHDDGCEELRLEVITTNARAIALYRKLGFTRTRELVVAQVDPAVGSTAAATQIDECDAQAWVAAHRITREPWQRDDAALASLRVQGHALRGLAVLRGGQTVAAAVLRDQGKISALLQAGAVDREAAAELLAAGAAQRPLRVVNVPDGEPVADALTRLGAGIVVRQHELRLAPVRAAAGHR